MNRKTRWGSLLTRRSIILVLVVSAVLGAGFGFISPSPNESDREPSASEPLRENTTETTSEPTTEKVTPDRTTATTESAPGQGLSDNAPSQARTASEEAVTPTPTTTRTAFDASESDNGGSHREDADEQADVTIWFEGNVTVGLLSDYPISSRTLNAVVNAPNTASTAGGA